jgi:hypothetical protein
VTWARTRPLPPYGIAILAERQKVNDSVSSSGAQVAAAGISSITLALVGLPYLALLWAFIGAVGVLVLLPPENKSRALLTILASDSRVVLGFTSANGMTGIHITADARL